MDLLTLLSEAARARASVKRDSEEDCRTIDLVLHSRIASVLNRFNPNGYCGKTYLGYCPVTTGKTTELSSQSLMNSGIVYRGQYWTANGFPYRKEGGACSLSDVLEDGNVPQKYYLSQKACAGILRRARKRGKAIPPALETALETVASQELSAPAEQDLTGLVRQETSLTTAL